MTDQQLERGIRLIRKVMIEGGDFKTTSEVRDHRWFLSEVAMAINSISPDLEASFSHGPLDSEMCMCISTKATRIKNDDIHIFWAPNEFNNQMWLGAAYDMNDENIECHGRFNFTVVVTATPQTIADQIIVEMQKI